MEKTKEELDILKEFIQLLLKVARRGTRSSNPSFFSKVVDWIWNIFSPDAYLPIQTIGVFPDCTSTSTNTQSYLCFSKKEVDSFKESMEMVAEHITTVVMSSKYHYHFRYYCKELSSYIF